MKHLSRFAIVLMASVCCLVSCASVSKRMPSELKKMRMHEFLTQDDPGTCRKYHYNFERQSPRLYAEQKRDSLFDVIEFIKTECGPAANIEVTRLLLLAEQGQLGDSLIGPSTIPQMLWYRSEREYLLKWEDYQYFFSGYQPVDNTHDNFDQFRQGLAWDVSSNATLSPQERTLGLFYAGAFDSALCRIQSDEMLGTTLRKSYDDLITRTRRAYPVMAHYGFLFGSWSPRGQAALLGKHPDIGMQLGAEGKRWRADAIVSHRVGSSKNRFDVDSLGQIVSNKKFYSWFFGAELGYKFLDWPVYSADVFVGAGYDILYSVELVEDPPKHVHHRSLAATVGLRQRVFLSERRGWYIGGIVRYNMVDYPNPGGTDLSGNTWTFSIVTGWSINQTLKQFLQKLNYRGNYRE